MQTFYVPLSGLRSLRFGESLQTGGEGGCLGWGRGSRRGLTAV